MNSSSLICVNVNPFPCGNHISLLNKADVVVTVGRCETGLCFLLFSPNSQCLSQGLSARVWFKLAESLEVYLSVAVSFSSFSIRNWKFSVRSLLLAAVCISIAVVWGVYRNEDRYCQSTQDTNTQSQSLCLFTLSPLWLKHGFATTGDCWW